MASFSLPSSFCRKHGLRDYFPSFISTPREHATFSDKIVADYAKHYSLVVTKST